MTNETPRLDLVPALADCKPDYRPLEYNVIVAPGGVDAKRGSLIMPDEVVDKGKMAQQLGRLVAVSPFAFTYENGWPVGSAPQIGDIVWFARFAGGPVTGMDGREYRILKDKDVAAVVVEPVYAEVADDLAVKYRVTKEETELHPDLAQWGTTVVMRA